MFFFSDVMKLYMQNSFKNKVVIKSDILMVSILVHTKAILQAVVCLWACCLS